VINGPVHHSRESTPKYAGPDACGGSILVDTSGPTGPFSAVHGFILRVRTASMVAEEHYLMWQPKHSAEAELLITSIEPFPKLPRL
jgi:hypothetical protein